VLGVALSLADFKGELVAAWAPDCGHLSLLGWLRVLDLQVDLERLWASWKSIWKQKRLANVGIHWTIDANAELANPRRMSDIEVHNESNAVTLLDGCWVCLSTDKGDGCAVITNWTRLDEFAEEDWIQVCAAQDLHELVDAHNAANCIACTLSTLVLEVATKLGAAAQDPIVQHDIDQLAERLACGVDALLAEGTSCSGLGCDWNNR